VVDLRGGLSAAVMCGLHGQTIVKDGSKDGDRNQELQDAVEAEFHGVVWVVGWPGRPGCVDGSGYFSGVNP